MMTFENAMYDMKKLQLEMMHVVNEIHKNTLEIQESYLKLEKKIIKDQSINKDAVKETIVENAMNFFKEAEINSSFISDKSDSPEFDTATVERDVVDDVGKKNENNNDECNSIISVDSSKFDIKTDGSERLSTLSSIPSTICSNENGIKLGEKNRHKIKLIRSLKEAIDEKKIIPVKYASVEKGKDRRISWCPEKFVSTEKAKDSHISCCPDLKGLLSSNFGYKEEYSSSKKNELFDKFYLMSILPKTILESEGDPLNQ